MRSSAALFNHGGVHQKKGRVVDSNVGLETYQEGMGWGLTR